MRRLILAALITAFAAGSAMAQSCETKAVGKDGKALSGAAKTSFMKKCKHDACEGKAMSRPDPFETAGDDALVDALRELTGDGEQGGGQGHGLGVLHGGIETLLTRWSSGLTIRRSSQAT